LFVSLGLVTDTLYAVASGSVGRRIKRRGGFLPAGRYVSGLTYMALGILAAVTNASNRHAGAAITRLE
jgi:threonine/homoserine/homoserine lactone efflux protein